LHKKRFSTSIFNDFDRLFTFERSTTRYYDFRALLGIGDRIKLVFDEPQFGVTPGQAAVLYDGETVLGGGIIERQ
jgi:tRNA U34 2-thiouridine synthase MnmA/TrmU